MKDKNSVLFIVPLPPPEHGSSLMCRRLQKSKLINGRFDCSYVNLSTSRGSTEVYRFSPLLLFRKGMRFLASYFRAFWFLLTKRPAICYLAITCYGIGFLKDAPFVLMCKLFGARIILHQHNKGMAPYARKTGYAFLLRKVYARTTVVLLSWRLYDDVKEVVKNDQVRIIPNSVPFLTRPSSPRRKHEGPVNFLFLSHLYREKGLPQLLDACAALKDRSALNFRCHIVGGDTCDYTRQSLNEEIQRRGLSEYVVCLGVLYEDRKLAAYEDADVFVFPTLKETFGLVLCEAMQHGLPCIGTTEGAIPDIIDDGKTGYVVTTGSSEELAEKMEVFCRDTSQIHRMGEAGKERCNAYFLSSDYEKKVCGLLHEHATA